MPGMTLSEAQALECNGCGDCCDSRRLAGQGLRFGWGKEQWAADNADGLLIPLREVHSGYMEADVPYAGAEAYQPFVCSQLQPQADGRALCGIYDQERPRTCGDFPVFGAHADELIEKMRASDNGSVWTRASMIPGCTWFDVWVYDPERQSASGQA